MSGSAQIRDFFAGKRIVITGGVGSVGREIAARLAELSPRLIRIIDNNESGLFDMESQRGRGNSTTAWEFLHVDVTHQIELERAFSGMIIAFTVRHSNMCRPVSAARMAPSTSMSTHCRRLSMSPSSGASNA